MNQRSRTRADLVTGQQIKNLFTKAMNNKVKEVEEMFAIGIDANTRDEFGNTIIHIAAQNGMFVFYEC